MVFAFLLTALMVWQVEQGRTTGDENFIFRLVLPIAVGLPASIALHLRLEVGRVTLWQRLLLFGGLAVVVLGYMWWLPEQDVLSINVGLQWLLLFLAAHLCISVAHVTPATTPRRFWATNMRILFRFITGVLFTGALTVGFLLALAGTDFLFDLDIEFERYAQIVFISIGILMTAFVLADMPTVEEPFELEEIMPAPLKLFNVYVLVPLAFVYLAILAAYSIQILALMSMPKGIVASMILYYSIVGLGAFLLAFPLIGADGHRLPNTFFRFFRFTLPLVMVLFWIAIGVRIWEYGFTVERTLVAWIGLWLTGVSVWLLTGRRRRIQAIPVTLGLIFALAAVGPFSVSKLSKDSQVRQVSSIISSLPGEGLPEKIKHTAELDSAEASRVGDILQYLILTHNVDALQPFSEELMDNLVARLSEKDTLDYLPGRWEIMDRIFDEWQIPDRYALSSDTEYWQLQQRDTDKNTIAISGFDMYIPLHLSVASSPADSTRSYEVYRDTWMTVTFNAGDGALTVATENAVHHIPLVDSLVSRAETAPLGPGRQWAELDSDSAMLRLLEGSPALMLVIENATLHREGSETRLQYLQGRLFLKHPEN